MARKCCTKCRQISEHWNSRSRVCMACQSKATEAARRRRQKHAIPLDLKRRVQADFVACFYCGDPPWRHNPLEIDHVTPLELGGQSLRENLVMACRRCNRMKGHKTIVDFVRYTRERFLWWWPDPTRRATRDV